MALEHAQEYLAKVLPWPQDGEPPAYVNIHWTLNKLNTHTGKPIWTGRAVRSLKEATNAVEWALRGVDTKDIYVCMSTQHDAIEKVSGKGNKYLAPARSQDNVVALKSLFLDLDAKGEDKSSYASVGSAAAALKAFIAAVGLPTPSAVVTSGGGLHVYWTMDRALTREEWQPLAYALAEATKQYGLKCDTQCTIDSARVLRVPGTFNRKLDTPRPVCLAGGRTGADYSVERLARSLEPFKGTAPAPTSEGHLPRRAAITGVSDLAAGVDRGASAPVDLPSVSLECPFIADAIATNGKAFANPLWNLTTLISTFAMNGRNEAHRMASGHPGYSKDSTDELYDRKEKERQSKGLGWPSCRTISASGATSCGSCKHHAAGKSPLNFAAKPAAPVPVANAPAGVCVGNLPNSDLPPGYKRLPNNVVVRIVIAADGTAEDRPLSTYPMFDPWIQVAPIYSLNFSTITENGRTTKISMPAGVISTKDGLKRTLWQQGLVIREQETKDATEFFVSWIEKLQKNKASVISSSPFGWSVTAGNIEGFIFGGSMWTPHGDRGASCPDPVIERQYRPTGDASHWKAAAALVTSQGRPSLDAIIASAFAAPLVKFTGEPGILLSTYSQESGIGKTTALRIAQAVWGDPVRAMQGLGDTNNSVTKKIGELQALPVYWDELKSEEDTKRFTKLVFDLTGRREKSRLAQTANFRESGTWQTMLVSASNDSILDHVMSGTKQTTAGLYRVFEYEVAPAKNRKGQVDQADASKLIGKLDNNYGVIGLEYAKFLGIHHAAVEKEVEAFYKQIGQEVKTENEERFWRVMLATLLMGAKYANALGFTAIDVPALKKFLIEVLGRMRSQLTVQPVDMKSQLNVSNALAQFVNAMRARHTLKTNIIHRGVGKPGAGAIKIVDDASKLDTIYVHIGVDDRVLRISRTYFNKWLHEQGYSQTLFMKSLTDEFGAKSISARIGAGTQFAGGTEYIIEIPLAGTKYANFIDEA